MFGNYRDHHNVEIGRTNDYLKKKQKQEDSSILTTSISTVRGQNDLFDVTTKKSNQIARTNYVSIRQSNDISTSIFQSRKLTTTQNGEQRKFSIKIDANKSPTRVCSRRNHSFLNTDKNERHFYLFYDKNVESF